MKRFSELTDGLWRVCSIRIAVPLLMEQQTYKVQTYNIQTGSTSEVYFGPFRRPAMELFQKDSL